MENNKNKKSVKFQGDMLNFYDFIQVFVFTTNHHLKSFKLYPRNFSNYIDTFLILYIQILTELEHSGVGRNKEQAARMLGHLVANAARLIRPYMDPILKVREAF